MHADFLALLFLYVCGTCGAGAGASTAICHRDQGLRNDIEASEIEEKRKENHTMEKDQVYLSGDKGTYRSHQTICR